MSPLIHVGFSVAYLRRCVITTARRTYSNNISGEDIANENILLNRFYLFANVKT